MNQETIKTELAKYNVTDATISEFKIKYSVLKITGLDDKEGYHAVHVARILIRDTRVSVEKTRKELKADSLEYGRMVDAEAKRITGMLEPLELELAKQEEFVDNEKKRIKEEVEKKTQETLNLRITELSRYGAAHDVNELKAMEQGSFDALLKYHKEIFDKEQAKKEEEVRLTKLESERIAKEKAELEEKQKAFEKQQADAKAIQDKKDAELKAAQKKLDDEKAAQEAKVQKEEADKRRIVQDKIEREMGAQAEREKIEKEQKDKAAQKALEELKTKRAEALKPDNDKLSAYAEAIMGIPKPSLKHADAIALLDKFRNCITQCCNSVINESKNL